MNIKFLGVGGGGSNTVNRMIDFGLTGVEFILFDTNEIVLELSNADKKILLVDAMNSREEILDTLRGAEVVFIVAGLGGNTGTIATPIVAECAREIGAETIAFVIIPFTYEGPKRKKKAESSLEKIKQHVDRVITIENDRLLQVEDKKTPMNEVFKYPDKILYRTVKNWMALSQNPSQTAEVYKNKILDDAAQCLMKI